MLFLKMSPVAFALMLASSSGLRDDTISAMDNTSLEGCFYKDEMFFEKTIRTATDKYADGHHGEQFIDIYTAEGDERQKRAAIVLLHGGSHEVGNRKTNCGPEDIQKSKGTADEHWCNDEMTTFATKLTQLGYVVFSIDYTMVMGSIMSKLGFVWNVLITKQKNNAAIPAARDARAAIRWIKRHAEDLGVDPEKIMMMGDSAGAITTLWANYRTDKVEPSQCCCRDVQGGQQECRIFDEDELDKPLFGKRQCPSKSGHSYSPSGCEGHVVTSEDGIDGSVAAAVSISGTLSFAEYGGADWTDSICCPNSQPPLVVVHSPLDSTIAYDSAKASAEQAEKVGLGAGFITVTNGGDPMKDDGHSPYAYLMDIYPAQQENYWDNFKDTLSKALMVQCD